MIVVYLTGQKVLLVSKKKNTKQKNDAIHQLLSSRVLLVLQIFELLKKSILKVQGFWLKKFDQASNKSFAKVSMELFSI